MARRLVYGGSFAPPLPDDFSPRFRALAEGATDPRIRDGMLSLMPCCETWWELPESSDEGSHPHEHDKRATVIPFDKEIADALYDHIPWDYELDALAALFGTIPAEQKELRDAAFHLLWHAHEFYLDREPLTRDKVVGLTVQTKESEDGSQS